MARTALEDLYSKKETEYFECVRHDVVALVPPNARRILDVGCGAGATGARLKQAYGVHEIIGIEFVPKIAYMARQCLDRVLVGDVETMTLDFPEDYFDCILCADVLEHCKDPWSVLTKLRSFLKDDGILIASIPNLRHLVVILKIIFNRWEYEQSGILDEGHLRFFTFHTIQDMLTRTGFKLLNVHAKRSASWKSKLLNFFSFGLLKPFSIFQYLVVAQKNF